jgi:hypothetical protein
MARYLVIINDSMARRRAHDMVASAPLGSRVEVKGARRTLPQNDRMWAMLTDISMQKEHNGRRYTPDQWKVLFLHALGRETQFIPALDGSGFIPWGQSSRDLSKDEMSNLIELMFSWGAESGVVFHDHFEAAYA